MEIDLNYKKILDKTMPVTFDSVGIEDGHEVERMWLADMVDGKWVEDYVVVRRDAYDSLKRLRVARHQRIIFGRERIRERFLEPPCAYFMRTHEQESCVRIRFCPLFAALRKHGDLYRILFDRRRGCFELFPQHRDLFVFFFQLPFEREVAPV